MPSEWSWRWRWEAAKPPEPPARSILYRPDIAVRDTDAFDSYQVRPGSLLRVNLATGNLVLQTAEFRASRWPWAPTMSARRARARDRGPRGLALLEQLR